MAEDKQLEALMKKQRQLILRADGEAKAERIGFAVGFLNGMRISKAITKEQYEAEYGKLQTIIGLKEAV